MLQLASTCFNLHHPPHLEGRVGAGGDLTGVEAAGQAERRRISGLECRHAVRGVADQHPGVGDAALLCVVAQIELECNT